MQIDSSVITTLRNKQLRDSVGSLDISLGPINKRDTDLQSFLEHKSQISVSHYRSRSRGGGSLRQEPVERNPETSEVITESKEEHAKTDGADSNEDLSFQEILSQLGKNSDFMIMMMTLSLMYFITAGVLFWTPNYLD